MKKTISFIAVFLISGAVAIQGKMANMVMQDKVTNKVVDYSIIAAGNYSGALYKNTTAKVVLTVYKLTGDEQQILWETTIDKGKLKNYPYKKEPLVRRLCFYNIHEYKEDLIASYRIIYYYRGYELYYEKNYLIKNSTGETLTIKI